MSAGSLYSDSIAEKILFEPIREGADKLCILTAHATPSMASWLLTSYEERGISNIEVELLVGSVADEGIDSASHEGFKDLHGNISFHEWGNFSCSYVYQPPSERRNCYIWLDHEKPVRAFGGSYEFTQTSLLHRGNGSMKERTAEYAYRIYRKAINRSIYCNHSEVEDYIIVHSSSSYPYINSGQRDENCIRLSLLARGGETGKRSGLNWGHRGKRNKNEAYISLPSCIAKTDFFPLNSQHFLVVTDDHHTLQLRVEQQNNKAITTPASNAQLGEYFRYRLGLANGTFVEKSHLTAYGRTDVTFYKIDEEQYYMDFSVKNTR